MVRARSPGRNGFAWISPSWLARELVRTDSSIAIARIWKRPVFEEALSGYREVVIDARYALMRGMPLPDLRPCMFCRRLIEHEAVRLGLRCPYCLADLGEEAPGYERQN